MTATHVTGTLVPRLVEVGFALSGTAPGTAAVVGLCCALLVTYS